MKKIHLATVLVAAASAVAQTPAAPAPAQAPQSTAAPAAPQQKKEIKDPAEYNAYVGAVQQSDAAAKISGLEAFLTQYPNSVMKEDALELLMGAYQQSGNQAKMTDTAQKVLAANPCNLRALALLSFTKRALAEGGQNPQQNLADAGQFGEKGLQCEQTAVKPEGSSDADFQKLKQQTAVIFNGSAGMSALQTKDYPKAQKYLRASADGDPTNLRDIYPLALAYLTATPPDNLNGVFYIARAANLAAGSPAAAQIEAYGKKQYTKYHGSDQGWTDLMAVAKANPAPPADLATKFTQYVPPTPAEQAAELVKTKDPKDMAFAEWELVLSEGKPEDADKVWSFLKGKPLQMAAQVIAATPTKISLAGSSDDIEKKTADIELTMTAPLTAKQIPAVDTEFQFEGTPQSYTPKPFVMVMTDGKLLVKAAPPAKKPPVHRKPAQ